MSEQSHEPQACFYCVRPLVFTCAVPLPADPQRACGRAMCQFCCRWRESHGAQTPVCHEHAKQAKEAQTA